MPQQTKIFRVFVSSTFTDMKEERMILQRDVFPKLEKFCEQNGARFQGVDLRWGVNEETQLEQKTLQTCFNEIDRCQKISPKPNFLILLGDKYGWQPIPEKIPEDEMDQIREILSKDEADFLIKENDNDTGWYRLDTNAIPAEFVLQPRGKKHKEYEEWKVPESEIRKILHKVVSQLNFSEEQKVKYFYSATHQEILQGALDPPIGTENPKEHVFAFVRQTNVTDKNSFTKDFIDLKEDGTIDTDSQEQLEKLKEKLKTQLGNHYITYPASWDGTKTNMLDAKDFADKIYKFLEEIIEIQIKETITKDEIEHEVLLHEAFKKRLTDHFRGRIEILETIFKYLHNNSEKRIMSLIGKSGTGKSSVIAEAIKQMEEENKNADNKALIVYRFLGTSSASSNIISLLQSVCGQIAAKFDKKLEDLADEHRKDSMHDLYTMTEIFKKCLALASPGQPIIVFLDALDQLSDTDNAKSLSWLPIELPENARIVVSALPELESNLSNTYIEQLSLLPEAEASLILEQWFDSISRKLNDDQQNYLLKQFSIEKLPIYLKLAYEQTKFWHSYEKPDELKTDVPGIINDFFDLLDHEHKEDFVTHAICYMLSGKYQGLTENEILEILAFDKEFWEDIFLKTITHKDHIPELKELKDALENPEEGEKALMKIPIAIWSRLYLDLEPFLTERDADGVPIITFFHRQFFEVLRKRYKLDEEEVESNY